MDAPAIIRLMRRLGLIEDVQYLEWTEVVPLLSDEALAVNEAMNLNRLPVVNCFGVPAIVLATEDDGGETLKVTLRSVARYGEPQTYANEPGKPAPLLSGPLIRSNEMSVPYSCANCLADSEQEGATVYDCKLCEAEWLRSTCVGLYSTLAALRPYGESPEMQEAKAAINLHEVIIK